jgi:hypothetical protein
MKRSKNELNAYMAGIIESRSPAGQLDAVRGWHNLLKSLLGRMAPYLQEGHLVTFRRIEEQESQFFEQLHQKVTIPASVGAIYLPPSVVFQMLYQRPAGEPRPVPDHSPENPPDEGIVLACRKGDFNVVVNALMAKPPFAPAIDVYEDGGLLAGYVYNRIDECIDNLSKVLEIHLQPGAGQESQ